VPDPEKDSEDSAFEAPLEIGLADYERHARSMHAAAPGVLAREGIRLGDVRGDFGAVPMAAFDPNAAGPDGPLDIHRVADAIGYDQWMVAGEIAARMRVRVADEDGVQRWWRLAPEGEAADEREADSADQGLMRPGESPHDDTAIGSVAVPPGNPDFPYWLVAQKRQAGLDEAYARGIVLADHDGLMLAHRLKNLDRMLAILDARLAALDPAAPARDARQHELARAIRERAEACAESLGLADAAIAARAPARRVASPVAPDAGPVPDPAAAFRAAAIAVGAQLRYIARVGIDAADGQEIATARTHVGDLRDAIASLNAGWFDHEPAQAAEHAGLPSAGLGTLARFVPSERSPETAHERARALACLQVARGDVEQAVLFGEADGNAAIHYVLGETPWETDLDPEASAPENVAEALLEDAAEFARKDVVAYVETGVGVPSDLGLLVVPEKRIFRLTHPDSPDGPTVRILDIDGLAGFVADVGARGTEIVDREHWESVLCAAKSVAALDAMARLSIRAPARASELARGLVDDRQADMLADSLADAIEYAGAGARIDPQGAEAVARTKAAAAIALREGLEAHERAHNRLVESGEGTHEPALAVAARTVQAFVAPAFAGWPAETVETALRRAKHALEASDTTLRLAQSAERAIREGLEAEARAERGETDAPVPNDSDPFGLDIDNAFYWPGFSAGLEADAADGVAGRLYAQALEAETLVAGLDMAAAARDAGHARRRHGALAALRRLREAALAAARTDAGRLGDIRFRRAFAALAGDIERVAGAHGTSLDQNAVDALRLSLAGYRRTLKRVTALPDPDPVALDAAAPRLGDAVAAGPSAEIDHLRRIVAAGGIESASVVRYAARPAIAIAAAADGTLAQWTGEELQLREKAAAADPIQLPVHERSAFAGLALPDIPAYVRVEAAAEPGIVPAFGEDDRDDTAACVRVDAAGDAAWQDGDTRARIEDAMRWARAPSTIWRDEWLRADAAIDAAVGLDVAQRLAPIDPDAAARIVAQIAEGDWMGEDTGMSIHDILRDGEARTAVRLLLDGAIASFGGDAARGRAPERVETAPGVFETPFAHLARLVGFHLKPVYESWPADLVDARARRWNRQWSLNTEAAYASSVARPSASSVVEDPFGLPLAFAAGGLAAPGDPARIAAGLAARRKAPGRVAEQGLRFGYDGTARIAVNADALSIAEALAADGWLDEAAAQCELGIDALRVRDRTGHWLAPSEAAEPGAPAIALAGQPASRWLVALDEAEAGRIEDSYENPVEPRVAAAALRAVARGLASDPEYPSARVRAALDDARLAGANPERSRLHWNWIEAMQPGFSDPQRRHFGAVGLAEIAASLDPAEPHRALADQAVIRRRIATADRREAAGYPARVAGLGRGANDPTGDARALVEALVKADFAARLSLLRPAAARTLAFEALMLAGDAAGGRQPALRAQFANVSGMRLVETAPGILTDPLEALRRDVEAIGARVLADCSPAELANVAAQDACELAVHFPEALDAETPADRAWTAGAPAFAAGAGLPVHLEVVLWTDGSPEAAQAAERIDAIATREGASRDAPWSRGAPMGTGIHAGRRETALYRFADPQGARAAQKSVRAAFADAAVPAVQSISAAVSYTPGAFLDPAQRRQLAALLALDWQAHADLPSVLVTEHSVPASEAIEACERIERHARMHDGLWIDSLGVELPGLAADRARWRGTLPASQASHFEARARLAFVARLGGQDPRFAAEAAAAIAGAIDNALVTARLDDGAARLARAGLRARWHARFAAMAEAADLAGERDTVAFARAAAASLGPADRAIADADEMVKIAPSGPKFRAGAKPPVPADPARPALPRGRLRDRERNAMSGKGASLDIARALQALSGSRSAAEVFRAWIDVAAIAAGAVEETADRARTPEGRLKALRKAIDERIRTFAGAGADQARRDEIRKVFADLMRHVAADMADERSDILGRIFMGMDWGNDYNGQFFTPDEIARLLAEIAVSQTVEDWKKAPADARVYPFFYMQEPACGAGALLLADAKAIERAGLKPNEYMLDGIELDDLTAKMAFVQCAVAGVPARIWRGNALGDPREWKCIGVTPNARAMAAANRDFMEAVKAGTVRFHPAEMKVDAATANPPFGGKVRFAAPAPLARFKPLIRAQTELLRYTHDRADGTYGADLLVDGARQSFAGYADLDALREDLRQRLPGVRFAAGLSAVRLSVEAGHGSEPELGWQPVGADFRDDSRWRPLKRGANTVLVNDAPHFVRAAARLAAHVAPVADFVPFAEIVAGGEIFDSDGLRAEGKAAYFPTILPDREIGHTIFLSLFSESPRRDLAHEAIHALHRSGRFRPHEWTALAAGPLNDGWRSRYRIDERYAGTDEARGREEAVCEAFADLVPALRYAVRSYGGDARGDRPAAVGRSEPRSLRDPQSPSGLNARDYLAHLGFGDPDAALLDAAGRAIGIFQHITDGTIGSRAPDRPAETAFALEAGIRLAAASQDERRDPDDPSAGIPFVARPLEFSAGRPAFVRTPVAPGLDGLAYPGEADALTMSAAEEQELAALVERIAPFARPVFADVLVPVGADPLDSRYFGVVTAAAPTQPPSAPQWLIGISRFGNLRLQTALHECFHSLWVSGRLDRSERDSLRECAVVERWEPPYGYENLDPARPRDLNELAAERFARWATEGRARPHGGYVGEGALENGPSVRVLRLFEKAFSGEIGARPRDPGAERAAMREAGIDPRPFAFSAGQAPVRRRVGFNVDAVDLNRPDLPDRIDPETEARLRALTARIAPFAQIEIADTFVNAGAPFGPASALDGVSGVRDPASVPGSPEYFVGIARLGDEDPAVTLRHELFHTLWLAGRIGVDQFESLRAAATAEKWPAPHGYENLDPVRDLDLCEIAAERFAAWGRGRDAHREHRFHPGHGPWPPDAQPAAGSAGDPAAGLTAAGPLFEDIEDGRVAAQPVEDRLDLVRFRRTGLPEHRWKFSAGLDPVAIGADLAGFDLPRAADEPAEDPPALTAALAELDRIAPFAKAVVADYLGYDGVPEPDMQCEIDVVEPAPDDSRPADLAIGIARESAAIDATGQRVLAYARAMGFLANYLSGRFSIPDLVALEEAATQDDWKAFAGNAPLATQFDRMRVAGIRYAAWSDDAGGSLGQAALRGGPAAAARDDEGGLRSDASRDPAAPGDRLTPAVRRLFEEVDLGICAARLDDPVLARARLDRIGVPVDRYRFSAGVPVRSPSAVAEPAAEIHRVFHGTLEAGFVPGPGSHFGTRTAALARLSELAQMPDASLPGRLLARGPRSPELVEAELRVRKAFVATDGLWDGAHLAGAIERAGIATPEEMRALRRLDLEPEDLLAAKGYDAIRYANSHEDPGSTSWLALEGAGVRVLAREAVRFAAGLAEENGIADRLRAQWTPTPKGGVPAIAVAPGRITFRVGAFAPMVIEPDAQGAPRLVPPGRTPASAGERIWRRAVERTLAGATGRRAPDDVDATIYIAAGFPATRRPDGAFALDVAGGGLVVDAHGTVLERRGKDPVLAGVEKALARPWRAPSGSLAANLAALARENRTNPAGLGIAPADIAAFARDAGAAAGSGVRSPANPAAKVRPAPAAAHAPTPRVEVPSRVEQVPRAPAAAVPALAPAAEQPRQRRRSGDRER